MFSLPQPCTLVGKGMAVELEVRESDWGQRQSLCKCVSCMGTQLPRMWALSPLESAFRGSLG